MTKFFLPVLLIFHLVLLSRLIFTTWPEMLAYPYFLNSGFSLYRDLIFPYPPGLVWLLNAVFNIFGFNPQVLKSLTWGIILVIDLVMYMILKRVTTSQTPPLFFLGIFIFLQSFLEGNMLWFDLATVLPLLLGFYFALEWIEKKDIKNLFLAGLFLGLAVMIKQTAVLYSVSFMFFYVLTIRRINLRELVLLTLGPLLLAVPLLVYVRVSGSMSHFLNWTLIYPLTQWSNFPGYVDFLISKRYLLVTLLLLMPLGGAILSGKQLLKDKCFLLTLLFLVAALITIYPRFSFFHLQPAIALAVILFAKIFVKISPKLQIKYLAFTVLVSFIITVTAARVTWGQGIRFYSLEDQRLGQKIASEVQTGERVFLLGVHASQYVFADRLPPKNWSDNFGWYLEIPGVQEWVIEGLKEDPPRKVIWRVPSEGSWYKLGVYQPQKIVEYIKQYYRQDATIDGVIEVWSRR